MPISTPHTLLRYLQSREVGPETWKNLVEHYGPAIGKWCLRRGLQTTDAEDVAQDVLVKMFLRLKAFVYDPAVGFRPYLRRLIQSAIAECIERAGKFQPAGGEDSINTLDEQPAREELDRVLQERFDHEVVNEAMVRVAREVQPTTWDAFRRQAYDSQPAVDVAAVLGMSVAAVYMAKSNVQKRLREAIRAIEGDDPSIAPDPTG